MREPLIIPPLDNVTGRPRSGLRRDVITLSPWQQTLSDVAAMWLYCADSISESNLDIGSILEFFKFIDSSNAIPSLINFN